MNQGKFVFSQLTDFLPKRIFDGLVTKYNANKYVRHFTCWNQLLCMVFGQLTGRDSLRDLMISIEPHKPKYYHLGFGKGTSRSNFANSNEKRDCRVFEDFAYYLIDLARQSAIVDQDFQLNIDGNVYAFDSTTIDLCLSVFWWAEFRKTKGGVKMHTLYDIKTSIPSFIHISSAKVHDVNVMDLLSYEPGGYYIFDRAYIDYNRLFNLNKSLAYFVARAKDNIQFRRMYSKKVCKDTGVLLDQIGKLKGFYVSKKYPEKLRYIKYFDDETGNELEFLSNNFELTAEDIAQLYKYRWKVELFFKWIKQHLKIKSFWGTSPNAVKIQIYSAIIAYCLVALVRNKLKIDRSTYEILQILSISLLDKTPIKELLTYQNYKDVKELYCKQLKINWN
ncbi:MAG: IS4 family transposase [Marinilabiliales bacterium]|nr:MAG: IS4 family transposase [Marinilabiliales bacterium]